MNVCHFFSPRRTAGIAIALLAAACGSPAPAEPATVTAPPAPPATAAPALVPTPADAALPAGWTDESALMAGLCFESVWDAAAGHPVFVLRTADSLTALYDLADNSGLCRHPVGRAAADFSGGRVIVGTWTRGRGCSAQHVIREVRRDDVARIFALTIELRVRGACPYDLVRPFWVGLPGLADYDVRLIVAAGRAEP